MPNKMISLWQAWQDTNDAVADQKAKVNPNKIVLLKDFIDCFGAGSTDENPTELKKLQLRHADDQEDRPRVDVEFVVGRTILTDYRGGAAVRHISMSGPGQLVMSCPDRPSSPFERLVGNSRMFVGLVPAALLPDGKSQRWAEPLAAAKEQLTAAQSLCETCETPESIAALRQAKAVMEGYDKAYFPMEQAAPLSCLLTVVDRAPRLGRLFETAQVKSVFAGQEGVIFGFWDAIKNLDNYSSLFPGRPKPPESGGDSRQKILKTAPALANI